MTLNQMKEVLSGKCANCNSDLMSLLLTLDTPLTTHLTHIFPLLPSQVAVTV